MPQYLQSIKNYYRDIYEHKNVLYSLIVKNLFGNYKNSILGFGWHFIVPVVLLLIYYIVFTELRIQNLTNFWIYLSAGIFPFNYMYSNLNSSSNCIISNSNLIKKIYFPRELLILSQIISSFITLLISYAIIIVIVAVSGHLEFFSLVCLPIAFMLMFIFSLGYSLFISSVVVYVRDIKYVISTFSMILFFITPIYFDATAVSGILSDIVQINPFAYYVELFQSLIYYGTLPNLNIVKVCIGIAIFSIIAGSYTFHILKRGFVERI